MPILVLFLFGLALTVFTKAVVWVALAFVLAVIGSFGEHLNAVCGIIAIFSSFIIFGYDSNNDFFRFMAVAAFVLMWVSLLLYINSTKESSKSTTTTQRIGVFDAINDSLVSLFHRNGYEGEKPNYKACIFAILFVLVWVFPWFIIANMH